MKRTICILTALGAVFAAAAQHRIEWRRDKVTQLIFPSEVVKFRTGYTSDDAVSQSDGRVLYIQPVDSLPESNLNVVTADGRYYAFNVAYDNSAETVNYIVTSSMAFYREPGAVAETTDAVPVPDAGKQTEAGGRDDASGTGPLDRVKRRQDYIVANNVARLQKLVFMLKGVYVDEKRIYFKFRIENNSNVPFDVDYIAFSITARKTKKTSTQERVQIRPEESDVQIRRLGAKSACEVVYAFEKFTIGEEKLLLAEMLEQGGDRNIGLRIPESFIIEARKL